MSCKRNLLNIMSIEPGMQPGIHKLPFETKNELNQIKSN